MSARAHPNSDAEAGAILPPPLFCARGDGLP